MNNSNSAYPQRRDVVNILCVVFTLGYSRLSPWNSKVKAMHFK